ncbi:hypothetical protein [Pseudaquidulcibacter saccharophilus]|uniref:hypothetical protein n=1 Tax=Pseudaquidulcibacter saccharophilus TaxID=2831900 RepID=UPI001EFF3FDC|nr:hypothetical protein [Pseudaquidulcibacter saccharophilus]
MFVDSLENETSRLISLAKSELPLLWLRRYDLKPSSDNWKNENYDFAKEPISKSAIIGMKLRKNECAFVLTIESNNFNFEVKDLKYDILSSISCLGLDGKVSCFELDGNGFQIVHLVKNWLNCEMLMGLSCFEWVKKSRNHSKPDYNFEIRKAGDFIPLPHHVWGSECPV